MVTTQLLAWNLSNYNHMTFDGRTLKIYGDSTAEDGVFFPAQQVNITTAGIKELRNGVNRVYEELKKQSEAALDERIKQAKRQSLKEPHGLKQTWYVTTNYPNDELNINFGITTYLPGARNWGPNFVVLAAFKNGEAVTIPELPIKEEEELGAY